MQAVNVILLGLLLSLPVLNAADSNCNYYQNLEPGQTYYIYNPNFPFFYKNNSHCKWQTISNQVTELNCSINMPLSNYCSQDVLTVSFVDGTVRRYCGKQDFILKGKNVSIELDSAYNSQGGTFLCSIYTEKEFDKYNCQCGWTNPTRIVNGTETGVNEYPMMAGMVDIDQRMLYCGATIIARQYVVTAAHCVVNKNVLKLSVIIGEHDVSTGTESNATKLYRVEYCVTHPQYNDIHNDIAICKIIGTIEYSGKVGPACLPFQHYRDSFGGDILTILGWGLTSFAGSKATALQKVDLNVITIIKCKQVYSNVDYNNICTYTYEKDSCQMDSGGPGLWHNPTTGNHLLVSIISAGSGCASDEPGINTRVGAYMDWIVSVTPDAQYCEVE